MGSEWIDVVTADMRGASDTLDSEYTDDGCLPEAASPPDHVDCSVGTYVWRWHALCRYTAEGIWLYGSYDTHRLRTLGLLTRIYVYHLPEFNNTYLLCEEPVDVRGAPCVFEPSVRTIGTRRRASCSAGVIASVRREKRRRRRASVSVGGVLL